MEAHRNRLAMFIDIHSFGSMILYGFGNGIFLHAHISFLFILLTFLRHIYFFKYVSKNTAGCSVDHL